MYCPYCGSYSTPDGSAYCIDCGTKLIDSYDEVMETSNYNDDDDEVSYSDYINGLGYDDDSSSSLDWF